jgi:esterase/lipase
MALVINRYQQKLSHINNSEIALFDDTSVRNTFQQMNNHIQEHNEQVDNEMKQMTRLQKIIDSSLQQILIPIFSEQAEGKEALYSTIISMLEDSKEVPS